MAAGADRNYVIVCNIDPLSRGIGVQKIGSRCGVNYWYPATDVVVTDPWSPYPY